MLTAHLPSGYVLGRSWKASVRYLMPAALVGAVLPDLDLIWFYFVDGRSMHHHRYWVHIPAFWVLVAAPTLLLLRQTHWFRTAVVFFAAIFMHLLVDSICGDILWGAPFSDALFSLVTVPPTRNNWVLSFILHWTFIFELMIWAAAAFLWFRRNK